MGKTFRQLKDALGDWLAANATRLPDGVRGDVINIAQRRLCRMFDLPANEKSDTFLTVAGTRDYSLPSDWSRPHTLWYRHPTTGAVVFLDLLSKERFDLTHPDAARQGLPSAYTIWGSTLQLGPTPDRVLTLNRNYYTILADLSADGDTNGLTQDYWEGLLWGALVEAEPYLLEDARLPLWRARFEAFQDELAVASARARTSGRRPEAREPS